MPGEFRNSLDQIDALADYFGQLAPLAHLDLLALLDVRSDRAKAFAADVQTLRTQQAQLTAAAEAAKGWKQRLPESEIGRALEQAKRFEASRLAWVQPAWWRLRGILKRCYDFRSHVVPPSWSQALSMLQTLCDCEQQVHRTQQAIGQTYGIKEDVESIVGIAANLREGLPQLSPQLNRLLGSHQVSAGEEDRDEGPRGRSLGDSAAR